MDEHGGPPCSPLGGKLVSAQRIAFKLLLQRLLQSNNVQFRFGNLLFNLGEVQALFSYLNFGVETLQFILLFWCHGFLLLEDVLLRNCGRK